MWTKIKNALKEFGSFLAYMGEANTRAEIALWEIEKQRLIREGAMITGRYYKG